LAGAALVIAESPAVGAVALKSGATVRLLWLLALPDQRLFAGDRAGLAGELAELAGLIGGFLTDSEQSRESIERAASAHRPPVEVFPPVVADRPCPACRSAQTPPAPEPRAVAQLARLRAGTAGGHRRPSRVGWDGSIATPAPHRQLRAPTSADQLRVAARLLAAVQPQPPRRRRPGRSVLVSGYDLKFALDLAGHLDRRADLDVTVDDWPGLGKPTARTVARLRTADAVFAEWARTSAVWLARRKRPGQFLAVRLHRFELDSPYPRDIAIEQTDAVVYIAPMFGRRIRDELGWPVDKLVHIPNFLDLAWLDRPKRPEARFALGMVGIEWSRKRFDLALDLLAAVRREDPRFRLVVRSVMPWHNEYAWSVPAERDYAGRCFTRIEEDPRLRDAVILDPPGRDMARWYRRVGQLASTSDAEGSHAAVAEAMASGAVPVVRPWPGADEVYHPQWIHTSMEDAVAAVLASADADAWAARADSAKAEIRRTHDPARVVEAWADLLHGDLDGARAHFAPALGGVVSRPRCSTGDRWASR
jgi:glycosyltransferase involved in cell wall biosynthesis